MFTKKSVLIPLLVDDPLWVIAAIFVGIVYAAVLIPLLVDDPLWEFRNCGNRVKRSMS